ncbi:MAG: ComF family protein [Fibrobacter sp.]|nr:ComF family protein [Fibrobacter sp.]
MRWIENVERFVFGAECLGCRAPSGALDPWLCPECVKELEHESTVELSPGPDTYSLYPMRPLTRRLVHALKYRGISGMATYLVKHSASVRCGLVREELSMFPKPLYFVPVPLHRARYRERGYNPAEKIAAALSLALDGKVCRWLKRRTFVVSQTKLSKEERERNVAFAFECVLKNPPTSGTVIVVDDVFTTGATTSACLAAFGRDFALPIKVCTLLYDEPASAVADFVADNQMEWEVE